MKISVITPVYNRTIYLPLTIHSVLNQTYRNIEHIIVDDCSEEKPAKKIIEIIRRFSDNRLQYYRSDQRVGYIKAYLKGVELASGEYIVFVDSDDMLMPKCIEINLRLLETNEKLGIVSNNLVYINSKNRIVEPLPSRNLNKEYIAINIEESVKMLPGHRFFTGKMIRKNALMKHLKCVLCKSMLNSNFALYTWYIDTIIPFSIICRNNGFFYHPQRLSLYRIHSKSYTFISFRKSYRIKELITILAHNNRFSHFRRFIKFWKSTQYRLFRFVFINSFNTLWFMQYIRDILYLPYALICNKSKSTS